MEGGGAREHAADRGRVTAGIPVLERDLAEAIARAAAAHLGVPVHEIDPVVPLSRLGLDSLGATELAAAIEDATGLEVPLDLVAECSNVRSLAAALGSGRRAQPEEAPLTLMRADARLPAEIRPRRSGRAFTPLTRAQSILLTGATGFIGGALLRTLVAETRARVICLVRSRREAGARERIVKTPRIDVVEGDLDGPCLGMTPRDFSTLAGRIDAVCHAGALVNWVAPYGSLRATNVAGTRELLRLACDAGATVHFISSLSVCYATSAPRIVDEAFDPLPHLAGLHFGYAQSKAVAEGLVRGAGVRGLPVRIYRPSLVSGDSRSGAFNADDLLSRLVAGCVRMGTAPDLDWRLDAVPVDVLAEAIVHGSSSPSGSGTLHLAHPNARHWRECVLWMRLYGYPLRLLPYGAWLRQLDRDTAADRAHPLTPLRQFFLGVPPGQRDTLPELHEEGKRPTARGAETQRALERVDHHAVPLDAALLTMYFDAFVAGRRVPAPPLPREIRRQANPRHDEPRRRAQLVERLVREGDPHASRVSAVETSAGSTDSVIGELTAWRSGGSCGVYPYRVDVDGVQRAAVLKIKPPDEDALAVGEALARLMGDEVGDAYARSRDRLGLTGAGQRELAIYRQTDRRFVRHAPRVLGITGGDADERALVLEAVEHTPFRGAAERARWTGARLAIAIRGLAALHAIWFDREETLGAAPWIGHIRTPRTLADMRDLWSALGEHAAPIFAAACQVAPATIRAVQDRVIERLPDWSTIGRGVPHTLIHNDFNPRNICVGGRTHPSLCAFDWELATVGAPQRDLAELLAFTLPSNLERPDVQPWLDLHRRTLVRHTRRAIDAAAWEEGFRAALYELLLDRLPFYALVHRVKPQPFLAHVVRTWMALYRLYPLC
jgi:thioester reductase-like protein